MSNNKLRQVWTNVSQLRYFLLIIFSIVFSFYPGSAFMQEEATSVPSTPTIVWPTQWAISVTQQPTITGLASPGNTIKVYIDGAFDGFSIATASDSNTGSFAYTTKRVLAYGTHTLKVLAVDDKGNSSKISNTITFLVEPPYVTPSILKITNINTAKPTIEGLANNNSLIQIFIDGKLDGEFYITNNSSGTAQFSYKVFTPLKDGAHEVYSIAKDLRGKPSLPSETKEFTISQSNANTTDKTKNSDSYDTSNEVHDGQYTIKGGDTLWGIAKHFYGKGTLFTKIVENNKNPLPSLITNPDYIRIGWKLMIK